MSLGPAEILVILVIALLVFGPTRLPEVGRQVGRTMREFRKFQAVMKRDLDEVFRDDEPADGRHGAEPAPTLPPKALPAATVPDAETDANADADHAATDTAGDHDADPPDVPGAPG